MDMYAVGNPRGQSTLMTREQRSAARYRRASRDMRKCKVASFGAITSYTHKRFAGSEPDTPTSHRPTSAISVSISTQPKSSPKDALWRTLMAAMAREDHRFGSCVGPIFFILEHIALSYQVAIEEARSDHPAIRAISSFTIPSIEPARDST